MIDAAFDYDLIINGVVSGLATEHLANTGKHESILECLRNIEHVLREQARWFDVHFLPKEEVDVYKIVVLSKVGGGSPFIPNPDGREYTRILVTASTILNITGPLGTYLQTIQPSTWTPLDLPDRSVVVLDATNTNATSNVMFRYTNQHP